ncbi:cofilin isoform X1 [Lingula anatina]|uniref:Cofilin isoform X1 n=2 Tax=Lingula anatina TaxID=7574 RepID=A0A1S3J7D0_LINAN|nr:cofilin isoform X1 [Lingula anatina]|eukprot:XP_013406322.1 cofilin isoform X1 [Lingula anatina]
MSSGVQVLEECLTAYNDIKMNKKYAYVIFKIVDHNGKALSAIGVDRTSCSSGQQDQEEQDKAYQEFLDYLRDTEEKRECCYALFDYGYTQENSTWKSSIIFFSWSPENAIIKQKMLYAASVKDFLAKLQGIDKSIQANSMDDVAESTVKAKCLKSSRAT